MELEDLLVTKPIVEDATMEDVDKEGKQADNTEDVIYPFIHTYKMGLSYFENFKT